MANATSNQQRFKCPRRCRDVIVTIPLEYGAEEFCPICQYPMFWADEVVKAAEKYEEAAIRAAAGKVEADKAAAEKAVADEAAAVAAEKAAAEKDEADRAAAEAAQATPMDVPHPSTPYTVHPGVWVLIGLLLIVVMISLWI